jgi:parallel beta helix pectate lyase-like protein
LQLFLRVGALLFLFGIAATVSDARPGGGACVASASRPLVVTNFSDNVAHPAKGTLRNILFDVVKPGETVTFCDTTPIELAGSLRVPSSDRGVTISGGAIGAPELRPSAFDIRATGLRIVETSFYELRVIVEAGDVTLTDDSFRQRRTDQPYVLLAENAPRLTIGGRGADEADIFDSQAQTAIAIQRGSDNVSIVGNTINTGGGRFAFEGDNDPGLTFDYNITDGDVISQALSGTISYNTLNGPGAGGGGGGSSSEADAVASAGKHLTAAQAIAAARMAGLGLYVITDGISSVGHLAIEGNTINNAALDVERPNVTIGGVNILTGGTGMGITCGYPDETSRAPITIEHNQLNGTTKGLRYRCSGSLQATLDDNMVNGGKQYGVFVAAAQAILKNNKVLDNRQRGIDLNCAGGATSGRLVLSSNTVSGNETGITVTCGRAGIASKLDGNIVTDNRGGGIIIARSGAGTAITGGRVQGNGTVQGNHAADKVSADAVGITVLAGAHATISRVAMGGNTGPGIESTAVAPPVLKFSGHAVRGVTCGGCLVEAFTIEAGAREGNPNNGEGAAYLGDVRASANGSFLYPATCDEATGKVRLTFTVTKGEGAAADTSGFSADVTCKPPFYDIYVRAVFNATCQVVDTPSQKITDPVNSTPVYYYYYITVKSGCHVGTQSYSVANADALKEAEKAEASANPQVSEPESSAEDFGEAALPIPAFLPDTTIYATELQTCSVFDPHPTVPYHYPPQNGSCGTGTRVVVEVINHSPNG